MKVFFIGSPRFNWKEQQLIYARIKDMGFSHTCAFTEEIDPETFYHVDDKTWQERYYARLKEMSEADCCVFETSTPSHAIGQLVQEALRSDKPVVALHTHEYHPVFMSGSAGVEKRLQVLEYSLDNLDQVLEYGFEVVKSLLVTRFTMLMPAEISKFLDEKSKKDGISRSEYIRALILDEMKKRGEA
jgi:hypothetical protein